MCLVMDCVKKTSYCPRKLFFLGTVGILGMVDVAGQIAEDKYHAWLVDEKLDKDMVRFFRRLRRDKKKH